MTRLVFVSHRFGSPQVFAEIRETKELVQLTDRENLAEWSVYPSHDGRYVYYTAGNAAYRVDTETFEEEELMVFPVKSISEGMIAAAMGTTALSRCDRWWAVPVKTGDRYCMYVLDIEKGAVDVILERDSIGHPQFCPDDSNLLFYAGPLNDRVWVIHRDGSGNRRLYERRPGEWITHETWLPTRRELAFVDWPNGVRAVHVDTGAERRITSFNAWHAAARRDGAMMVADTNFPDIGLQLFSTLDGVGEPRCVCYPEASSLGEHWDGPFPYENGPVKVYAPQHTHPHPSFSPDGASVVYTSDRSGFAQVYEVYLDESARES